MKNILAIQSHALCLAMPATVPLNFRCAVWAPMSGPEYRTVHSNHTQYGKWTGCVIAAFAFDGDRSGIADIDKLQTCDAVLSYLGSAEQGEASTRYRASG